MAFTEDQLAYFADRFKQLDISGTGEIDRETMSIILRSEAEQLDNLMIVLLFEKYDINNDGKINFEEFISFCREMEDLSEITIMKQIFDIADVDHNEYLDVDEVERIGRLMGMDVTTADAWATIAALDQDGNNTIDFSEFCSILIPSYK